MIKWGQKSKSKKIPRASNKTSKKSLDQNFTHQKIPSRVSEPLKFPQELHGRDTWELSQIFRLFSEEEGLPSYNAL